MSKELESLVVLIIASLLAWMIYIPLNTILTTDYDQIEIRLNEEAL
jgi:hypothetical protein